MAKVKATGVKKKGHRPNTTFHKVQSEKAKLNQAEALKLRVSGLSLREIGARLGVSHATVDNYIKAELSDVVATKSEERNQMREIQRQRVELALAEAIDILTNRELEIETVIGSGARQKVITVERFKAVADLSDVIIKGTARLAAFYGLDAPKENKVEHSGEVTVSQEKLDEVTAARMAILRNTREQLSALPQLKG